MSAPGRSAPTRCTRTATRPAPRSDELGFDLVLDAAGAQATRAMAVDLVRPGGRVVCIGLAADDTTLAFHTVVREQIAIIGSYAYTMARLRAGARVAGRRPRLTRRAARRCSRSRRARTRSRGWRRPRRIRSRCSSPAPGAVVDRRLAERPRRGRRRSVERNRRGDRARCSPTPARRCTRRRAGNRRSATASSAMSSTWSTAPAVDRFAAERDRARPGPHRHGRRRHEPARPLARPSHARGLGHAAGGQPHGRVQRRPRLPRALFAGRAGTWS